MPATPLLVIVLLTFACPIVVHFGLWAWARLGGERDPGAGASGGVPQISPTDVPITQAPILPGFVPLPIKWYHFTMLYLSVLVPGVLALPERWRSHIFRELFPCSPRRGRRCQLLLVTLG